MRTPSRLSRELDSASSKRIELHSGHCRLVQSIRGRRPNQPWTADSMISLLDPRLRQSGSCLREGFTPLRQSGGHPSSWGQQPSESWSQLLIQPERRKCDFHVENGGREQGIPERVQNATVQATSSTPPMAETHPPRTSRNGDFSRTKNMDRTSAGGPTIRDESPVVQLHRLAGKNQRLLCHLPEVGILPSYGPQPCVLKLPRPP